MVFQVFVTAAYRKKMEELEKFNEEEKRRDRIEGEMTYFLVGSFTSYFVGHAQEKFVGVYKFWGWSIFWAHENFHYFLIWVSHFASGPIARV